MGATRALAGDDSGHAIEVTSAAMAEADALQEDPLRKYKIWRKVHTLPCMQPCSLAMLECKHACEHTLLGLLGLEPSMLAPVVLANRPCNGCGLPLCDSRAMPLHAGCAGGRARHA